MKVRRWHWLVLALIILIVCGYLLARKLPTLIEHRIGQELAVLGVDSFEMGAPFWGLSGAGTRKLNASGQFNQWQFDVSVEDFQADYHWRALIDGQVSRISLANMRIKARQISPSRDERLPVIAVRSLLNQISTLALPVEQLYIETLEGEMVVNETDVSIQGHNIALNNAKKALAGSLSITANTPTFKQDIDVTLRFQPVDGQPWIPDIEFQGSKKGVAFLQGALKMAPAMATELEISARLQHSNLDTLLADIVELPLLTDIPLAATVSLRSIIRVPDTLDVNDANWLKSLPADVSLSADMETGAYPGGGLQRSHAHIALEAVNHDNRLEISMVEPLTVVADLDNPELATQLGLKSPSPVSLRVTTDSPMNYRHAGTLEVSKLALAVSVAEVNRLELAVSSLAIVMPPSFASVGVAPSWLDAITGSASVSADLALAAYPKAHLTQLRSHLSVDATKKPDNLSLSLTAPLTASAQMGLNQWSDLAQQLHLKNPTTVSMKLSSDAPVVYWPGRDGIGALKAKGLTLSVVDDNRNNVDLFVEQVSVADRLDVKGRGEVSLRYGDRGLPLLTVMGTLAGEKNSPEWKGTFAVPDLDVTGKLTTTLFTPTVTFDGTAQLKNLPRLVKQAEDLGFDLPDIQLASGEATLSASGKPVASSSTSRFTLGGQSTNVSGLLSGLAFTDLGVRGEFVFDGVWKSSSPISLSVPNASAGVELTNIEAELNLLESEHFAESQWRLESLTANAFAGQIALSQPAELSFPFNENKMTVSLSNLDLAEILMLYAKQGVSGTGRLSGTIPVELTKDGIRIDGGSLHNLEVGRIQFSHGGTAGIGNEQLSMTLRLLENFNYALLSVTTRLEPDGQLALAASLSGNNPAEFDGRTVNFNINLEENIFDLYKVLSLSDKLTRQLEKKIEGQ